MAIEWPKRLRDFRWQRGECGLLCRTTRELRNHWGIIPTGTVGRVNSGGATSWTRLDFVADPCRCCGVRLTIAGCDRSAFELLGTFALLPTGTERMADVIGAG